MSTLEQLALKVDKKSWFQRGWWSAHLAMYGLLTSYHLFTVTGDPSPKPAVTFYNGSPFLSGIFLRCIGREPVGEKGADCI